MPELTMESLAARLEAVEKQLAARVDAIEKLLAGKPAVEPPRAKDWRRTVGRFDADPEFAQTVIAEAAAIREAEREAARRGDEP